MTAHDVSRTDRGDPRSEGCRANPVGRRVPDHEWPEEELDGQRQPECARCRPRVVAVAPRERGEERHRAVAFAISNAFQPGAQITTAA
jgi:hypothetical protein